MAGAMDRRSSFKVAGTITAAASGLAGILATGRAPAYARPEAPHRPLDRARAAADRSSGRQMPEASKALGGEVNLETINANDLQRRSSPPPLRKRR